MTKRRIHLIAAALLLLACGRLSASDPWTRADVARQVALTATLVADWGQTLDIERHGGRLEESNPLLGRHPSRASVNAYFLAYIAGTWLLVDLVPQRWRLPVQVAIMVYQSSLIQRNHSFGVRLRF